MNIDIKIVGKGLVNGDINVPEGSVVTLTASPFTGFEFEKWQLKLPYFDYQDMYLGDDTYLLGDIESVFEYTQPTFSFIAKGNVDIVCVFKDTFIECITDRTITDIINRTPKAYMNSEDWNRIEFNIRELASILSIPVTTNYWDKNSIPTKTRIDLILANLRTLREARKPFGIPEVPNHPINTYEKINDIEMILQMVHDFFYGQKEYVEHCGETFAGSEIGIL